MAKRIGLSVQMISAGELHSNFSDSALILLAIELKDDFGLERLKPYAADGVILEPYREMPPKMKKKAAELLKLLRSGVEIPTGNYGDD